MQGSRRSATIASCDQFMSRLQAVLDERSDPCRDPGLKEHVHSCESCRLALEIQARTLQEWEATAARGSYQPAEHLDRPRARGLVEPARGRAERAVVTRGEAWRSLALLACSIACLVGSWKLAFWNGEEAGRFSQGAFVAVTGVQAEKPLPLPSVGDASAPNIAGREGRMAISEWGETWDDFHAEMDWDVRHWLVSANRPESPGPVWLRPVRGSLAPFANSLSSTFNVLKLTWPSGRASETSLQGDVNLPLSEGHAAGRPS